MRRLRPRPSGRAVALALLLLAALPAAAQQDAPPPVVPEQDESLLLGIKLAARGGDFDLAHRRADSLQEPRLRVKGNIALGVGYLQRQDAAKADTYIQQAIEDATYSDRLRSNDRVSILLYAAESLHGYAQYRALVDEVYAAAADFAGNLTFINHDLAMVQLARVGRYLGKDKDELLGFLNKMSDAGWRDKMSVQLGLGN